MCDWWDSGFQFLNDDELIESAREEDNHNVEIEAGHQLEKWLSTLKPC